MEHKPVATWARRLWSQGGLGRVAAVLVVLLGAAAIGLFRYGVSHSAKLARASGWACGMTPAQEPARAQALIAQLGMAVTETTWHGNPAWLADGVTVAMISMGSPCDTVLSLRAQLVDAWPADAPVRPEDFETPEVRRSFEVAGAALVPGRVGEPVELVRSLPLARLQGATLRWERQELAEVAAMWRQQWFAQALRVAAGQAPPPRQMQFRPGKDPATRLREVEAFLRDAGRAPGRDPPAAAGRR